MKTLVFGLALFATIQITPAMAGVTQTVMVHRITASNCQNAVAIGTWSGKACTEKKLAKNDMTQILPRACSRFSFVTNVKKQVRGTLPNFVDHNQAVSGSFDSWFAANPRSTLPYWTNELAYLQAVQNPTNIFTFTPLIGLSTNIYGWLGLTNALNALRWTGRVSWPYQAEKKIAPGNPQWYLGYSCSEAYSYNQNIWDNASYIPEVDDVYNGAFYGIIAVSWSEPEYYDIACERKRANAIVNDITGVFAHSADLYSRGGGGWNVNYGPLGLRSHQFSYNNAISESSCPDGGGYTTNTYKYFGSLTAATTTQRVFNTKNITPTTWPFSTLAWTCPLPADYPSSKFKGFHIGDAVAALKWDVSSGFQYLDNSPPP